MTYFNPSQEVTKETIEFLLSSKIEEGRALDYKAESYTPNDEGRKAFLADVTAFANSAGGVVLIGVSEERESGKNTGKPEKAGGIPAGDADAEIRRFEGWLANCMEPQMFGLRMYAVAIEDGRSVLVVQVPRSWTGPHLMRHNDWVRFCVRRDRSNQILDWQEIRAAFGLSEGMRSRIERFRNERIAKIASDQSPVPLKQPDRLVLHLIPISAFAEEPELDLRNVYEHFQELWPMATSACDRRFNFEGVLTWSQNRDGEFTTYVQFFRQGIIEATHARLASVNEKGTKYLPSVAYEKYVLERIGSYFNRLKESGTSLPILVCLTLMGVKDAYMSNSLNPAFGESGSTISQDMLVLPPLMADSFTPKFGKLLKPAFDAVWQAADWPGSLNYDGDEWVGSEVKRRMR